MADTCPSCGATNAKCLDSRAVAAGPWAQWLGPLRSLGGYLPHFRYRRRRYRCITCTARWSTIELAEGDLGALLTLALNEEPKP